MKLPENVFVRAFHLQNVIRFGRQSTIYYTDCNAMEIVAKDNRSDQWQTASLRAAVTCVGSKRLPHRFSYTNNRRMQYLEENEQEVCSLEECGIYLYRQHCLTNPVEYFFKTQN